MATSKTFDFEAGLNELNALVDGMEQGGLSLDETLKQFERGVKLARLCQKKLQETQQQVKQLVESNGKDSLVDYHDN